MTSTVPAFRDALRAVLAQALPSALVTVGHPYPLPQAETLVVIGPAKGRRLEYVHGMAAANETYSVEVVVSVVGPSQAPHSSVVAAAYAAADAARDAVAAWDAQGCGGVVSHAVVEGSEEDELLADGVRECAVVLDVAVIARV